MRTRIIHSIYFRFKDSEKLEDIYFSGEYADVVKDAISFLEDNDQPVYVLWARERFEKTSDRDTYYIGSGSIENLYSHYDKNLDPISPKEAIKVLKNICNPPRTNVPEKLIPEETFVDEELKD